MLYYYVLVYKHEKDFLRTFELPYFQQKLLDRFMPEYRNKSETEKKAIFDKYVQSLEADMDYSEVQRKTAEGYFVTKNVLNKKKMIQGKKKVFEGQKKKKKKREILKNDFYKFQLKSLEDKRVFEEVVEDDGDELDMGLLDDEDYLSKRKERLKAAFQDDVMKLQKM